MSRPRASDESPQGLPSPLHIVTRLGVLIGIEADVNHALPPDQPTHKTWPQNTVLPRQAYDQSLTLTSVFRVHEAGAGSSETPAHGSSETPTHGHPSS